MSLTCDCVKYCGGCPEILARIDNNYGFLSFVISILIIFVITKIYLIFRNWRKNEK